MKLQIGEIRGKRVSCYDELKQVGYFYFEFNENKNPITFTFMVPDEKRTICKIHLCSNGWQVTDNLNSPTICPSIRIDAQNNGWHGKIIQGIFKRV